MLRVILVDDEPLARAGLTRLLTSLPGVSVLGVAASVEEAKELILQESPDGIFLDIQMPGASGFDLLRTLDRPPPVVFVTAHSQHAARAFDFHAIDYLLKPVRLERLAEAVRRLTSAVEGTVDTTPYDKSDRVCLRTPERTLVTRVGSILAIEADGDFSRFHFANEPSLLICQPLGSFLAILPSPPILRLDRSLAVNLDQIEKIEREGRTGVRLWLRGCTQPIPLGRTAHARLRSAFQD